MIPVLFPGAVSKRRLSQKGCLPETECSAKLFAAPNPRQTPMLIKGV